MTTPTLSHGSHDRREDGMCLMEAVAFLAGERHSDHPACACPVLSAYGRRLNDVMGKGPDGDLLRAFYLGDLAPRLIDTLATPEVERRRACVLVDGAVRVLAPMTLEAMGRTAEAQALRALSPVVDTVTARAAADAAEAANRPFARAAAWDVVYAADAAEAAAEAAAVDAADTVAVAAGAANAAGAAVAAADAANAAGAAAAAAAVAASDDAYREARAMLIRALEVTDAPQ